MRAVRLVEIGEPLEMHEVPAPQVGEMDVLVRIKAAGICHSDVHYRAGTSAVGPLPQTLGHEIAGVVEAVGFRVKDVAVGDRVCLHYLVTCGACRHCRSGNEQFCVEGRMLGKQVDGGYAEFIAVTARNAVPLPEDVSLEAGAVLMCSSATSFHALRKARLQPGESVAVFGAGGLGMSAVQLARAFGALAVYAVDISDAKLAQAETHGAVAVNAAKADPVAEIRRLTGGGGVDVALEVIGLPATMEQAVRSLGVLGRAVMVGIASEPMRIDSYTDLLCKEAEVIGSSDHLLSELPLIIEFARQGSLNLSQVVTHTVPLEAAAINETMDALERFGGEVRTVITPDSG
jgi:2-desacetyl-2-hydroxyethyl bacteriochlorophyllide A dehydrogenase